MKINEDEGLSKLQGRGGTTAWQHDKRRVRWQSKG